MEHNKYEVTIIENSFVVVADERLHELNDLQLTLVGGGVGETVLS